MSMRHLEREVGSHLNQVSWQVDLGRPVSDHVEEIARQSARQGPVEAVEPLFD